MRDAASPEDADQAAMRALIEKTLALEECSKESSFGAEPSPLALLQWCLRRASDAAMLAFETARRWLPCGPIVQPSWLGIERWLTQRISLVRRVAASSQTIAALSLPTEEARHRVLSVKIAIGKILLTLIALACGASVGREGPTVQVGASIMHALRRFARFSAVWMSTAA